MNLLEKAQAMPEKIKESKWDQYMPVIEELRSKGYSWQDVTDFLNEHAGLDQPMPNVYYAYRRLKKR